MISRDFLSGDIIERLCSSLDFCPIRAPSPLRAGLLLSFPIALSPVAYFLFGCSTDWFVVSGLFVDIVGALILAIPDIPSYRKVAYGGRVREAYSRLILEERDGRIAPDTRYYDAFHTALRERLLPRDVPENAYFDIEPVPRIVDDIVLIKNKQLEPVQRINLANVERILTNVYENEDGKFRRLGIFLLVIGLSTQLLGIIVSQIFIPGLC